MRNSDFAFISSALGSVALPLLLIGGFHILGSLWQPMTGGGQEVNPRSLMWLMVSVPVGAMLGCLVSWRHFQKPVAWWTLFLSWCGGSSGGFTVHYNLSVFLLPPFTLPICFGGLLLVGFVYMVALRKLRRGPQYIKLPM
jgi:hypothetical protein